MSELGHRPLKISHSAPKKYADHETERAKSNAFLLGLPNSTEFESIRALSAKPRQSLRAELM
jgi:hypothetical protein